MNKINRMIGGATRPLDELVESNHPHHVTHYFKKHTQRKENETRKNVFFYSIILSLLLFPFHSSPSRSWSCSIFTVWVCTSFYFKITRDAASIFLLLFKPYHSSSGREQNKTTRNRRRRNQLKVKKKSQARLIGDCFTEKPKKSA